MTLLDQISEDIKTAMKAADKVKLEPLRYLKSLLIQNKTAVKPIEEMDVLISHVKKLKDSMPLFPQGSTLLENLIKEISVLELYMPKSLNEDEVIAIIKKIISNLGSPNMGQVMKELSPQIKGRFDGKRANDLVKTLITTN